MWSLILPRILQVLLTGKTYPLFLAGALPTLTLDSTGAGNAQIPKKGFFAYPPERVYSSSDSHS